MKKILRILLIFLTPPLVFLISLKLAFTEPFLEIVYATTRFAEDGIPKEEKLNIAKLGLRAVLSEKGMKEFVNSGLFNQREILHMQDVKALLSKFFAIMYFIIGTWIILVISIRDSILIGKSLFYAFMLSELLVILILSPLLYFESFFYLFHDLFFDPYSWKFYPGDMLIVVYPMEFWFRAFALLVPLYLFIASLGFATTFIFLFKKKAFPIVIKPRTLDK